MRDIGDFSEVSEIAAYNSVRLQELWIEKLFYDDRLSLRVGNMALDNDFFVSTSTALYVNSTINTFITTMSFNVPNLPTYPVASPGVRLKFLPTPETYVQAGVYGMDNSSNPAMNNRYGTRFALTASSGMLVMTEAGYLLNQEPNNPALQGTYRIGSYVHTANYDTWGSQAQYRAGIGPLQSAGTNYGVYNMAEQQIYEHDARSISVFLGGGGAPSNVNFNDWSIVGGFNFGGFIPGRSQDVAGLAFARSTVSNNYSNSRMAVGGVPYTVQTVVEATYEMQVTPWLIVQPDVQYVVNPSGLQTIPNAVVLGMSTIITF